MVRTRIRPDEVAFFTARPLSDEFPTWWTPLFAHPFFEPTATLMSLSAWLPSP